VGVYGFMRLIMLLRRLRRLRIVELILGGKGGRISFEGVKRGLEDVSVDDEGEVMFGGK